MNNEQYSSQGDITPAGIEAIIRKARADRAEAMRNSMIEFGEAFKRWLVSFRPIRERAPHKGAWA